jgi:IS5 family transposase
LKDLITVIFVIVDDLYQEIISDKVKYRLHYAKAVLSDSEVITIAAIGEMMSIDSENAWVRYVGKNLRDLFPRMCERSRFNRLRRNLAAVTKQILVALGTKFAFTEDEYRIADSFPLSVCEFARAKFTKLFKFEGASYGYCPSKKQTYFGYKVHALCVLNGYISDFVLTPASADDRDAVWELIEGYNRHLKLIGDKGYIGASFARELLDEKGVLMIAMKRDNAKTPDSKPVRQRIFKSRRRIETSFSQLDDQFNAESTRAKSFWGLLTRLQSQILAFNLCFAVNWLLGVDNIACIKSLVF